jgi:hypothetical protein
MTIHQDELSNLDDPENQAIEHDAWFHQEVAKAVAEAEGIEAEWDSAEDVKAQSKLRQAVWLRAARASEKATA